MGSEARPGRPAVLVTVAVAMLIGCGAPLAPASNPVDPARSGASAPADLAVAVPSRTPDPTTVSASASASASAAPTPPPTPTPTPTPTPRPTPSPTPAGATAPPPAPIVGAYRVTAYRIRTIPQDELPYVETVLPSKALPPYHDADGVPMKLVGDKLYYSPAGNLQYALRMEDAYRRTNDADYLAIADKVLARLMENGTRSHGGVYLAYEYDFAMHHIATEVMDAPWYSAMAQGLGLSLAVRLYRDTGEERYLEDARLLFATFQHLGRGKDPWVTYVDGGHYLWLEEYPEPTNPSDHTANGFNFAVFGLYDYYEETHDASALKVLRASLTTMRHYIAQYRIPGSYSKYCLRHGKPQAKYHKIVTWQLGFLYRISGDSWFRTMQAAFIRDYH
jgi:D-glucuronyl C5-epimerase C-terminus